MLALAEAPAEPVAPTLLLIWLPGIWALVFICVLVLPWAPPPGFAPRISTLLFMVAPAGGAVMVAAPPVVAPVLTPPVAAVWAPAAPAAVTRASVSSMRFIAGSSSWG